MIGSGGARCNKTIIHRFSMKNLICIALLICSFQYNLFARKFYSSNFDDDLIDFIEESLDAFPTNSDESNSYENEIDPNDRVDIDLWNKLNDEDIKNMPQIDDFSNEATARRWLKWLTRIKLRYRQVKLVLSWNYKTNLTDENQQAVSKQRLISSPFHRLSLSLSKQFNEHLKNSTDEELKRIFNKLAQGAVSTDDEYLKKTSELHSKLDRIYSTTKVCELNNTSQCYTLTPYLEQLMQTEKDYDRLLWAWKGWYDQCGNQIRPVYLTYIDLINKNIKQNGFKDLASYWIKDYEMGNDEEFERTLDQILETMMPLYKQLHAFVRGRLCKIYPNRFDCNGPIPAHLLGNMWAQEWNARLDDLLPYPNVPMVNITGKLEEQQFTIHRLYKTAEEFFTSINLYPMTPKFWAYSLFKKPIDRDVVCHPSAFDMSFHDDYRVKVCTELTDDYFYAVHHEMGHIEYFMAYKDQPLYYRDGANSGFHEAIGDTIGMYAMSPKHLMQLGFLDKNTINSQYEINHLMRVALEKIPLVSFAYTIDKYRYALFRDQIKVPTELNAKWWEMRLQYGGIMPPVPRHDPENFDPGAKFHVATNVPYAQYLIALAFQFQFHRGLCRLQGDTKRLHMCDIHGNKHVGEKFRQMLELGSSKLWPEALKSLTGESQLEPQAMLDFFEPLHRWLKMENLARGYPVDWN